ncbi:caspase-activated nuclease [Anopheles darlingi]|uniref:Caspase-activated nuclease n=1 Tax=Anopheles darlingi TaxID=43151 RepID=W5JGP2_ANODA|nr:DNA fragmentation factor subunit beta [Anopheles darlingi]ETN62080.1 caspase-activated nuclease [Anopheles darlingi]
MFDLFPSKKSAPVATVAPMQGYKITDVERSRKFGVAANSFRMLREKASEKFKIADCRVYLAQDGTEVTDEEYFQTLPPQTLLVIADKDAIIQTDFELMYGAIKATHSDLLNAGELAKQFVSNNQPEISKILIDAQRGRDDLIRRSSRNEHEQWFEGIDDRAVKTKEEVMKRRGQDRVRGYFYKAKDELTKCAMYRANPVARELIDEMIELFRQLLAGFDYFSCMFDRTCQRRMTVPEETIGDAKDDVADETDAKRIPPKRLKLLVQRSLGSSCRIDQYNAALCSVRGDFRCMGLWDDVRCRYDSHRINPYANREALILFQVWNLDHQIEISRTVLPSILTNIGRMVSAEGEVAICKRHKRKGKQLSVITYFLELFTLHNLKLVHIVCHDKGAHDLVSRGTIICDRCEEYQYIKQFQRKLQSSCKDDLP